MPSPADPVLVRVPAKINLRLAVGPLRPDGYHELINVFHAVDLYDEIVAAPGTGISLDVAGADAVPADERNIAWQAALRLAEAAGRTPDVHLSLRKAIPVAGGMAGGSADAAGALLACAQLWGLDVGLPELITVAAGIGSDVAFPLLGGTAVGTGRGEILTPVAAAGFLHWVLALADFGISAGAAYRELDRLRDLGLAPGPIAQDGADPLLGALDSGDPQRVAAALANDLEPAVVSLAPALAATLDAGRRHGALAALVSGSGPTCAFLCADEAAAVALAITLERACAGTRVVSGPAPGARVVR